MTGEQLRLARRARKWTQQQTAAKLNVSQPYLSLLEKGTRQMPKGFVTRAVKLLDLSPVNLPMDAHQSSSKSENALARDLAGLGYPGYSYLRARKKRNPAQVLFSALCKKDLDSRMTEALPWVVLSFPKMNWEWLMKEAKANDVQNRLGYVTTLARKVTELQQPGQAQEALSQVVSALERSRLAKEDTLCRDSMSEAEKRWLIESRPEAAKHWNLLTDLSVEQLSYAR